eukprot:GFUD01031422.1.p1 GENE.GFUD01031422.1~~GFUD01031422.1.p1  ORF type:complete len:362 (+),score=63.20 GFUD01031422.1:70-1086(+)
MSAIQTHPTAANVRLREAPQLALSTKRGFKSIVAGGLTGGINICIVFPTEFIKTQLQLDSGRNIMTAHHSVMVPYSSTLSWSHSVLQSKNLKLYNGSVDVVKKTIKEKGLKGMYRGVSVLLCGTVPTYSIRFGVFDFLKGHFCGRDGNLSPLARLGCGMGTGVAEAVLLVTWVETLKVRLISDQKKKVPLYRGPVHAASSIIRNEGPFGLYKGFTPTVLKQGSSQAIRFSVMESLRSWYTGGDINKSVPKPFVAMFGAVAGGASVLGNTPVDVVKTRMQNGSYSSSVECARQVARNEGVRGFYKGCLPRMNRVCLEVGLAFVIYDTVMEVFKTVWPSK